MAISLVRSTAKALYTSTSSGTNGSISITAAASGNILLYTISTRASMQSGVNTISCTNVTWMKLGSTYVQYSGDALWYGVEVWYGVVSGGSSGTTISVNHNQNIAGACSAAEFSGIATSSINDGSPVSSSKTSTYTSISTGNYASGNANDLVFAVIGAKNQSSNPAAPTNFTALSGNVGNGVISCDPSYQIVSTTGTYSGTWSVASNPVGVTLIGGLKAAVTSVNCTVIPDPITASFVAPDPTITATENVTLAVEAVAVSADVPGPVVLTTSSVTVSADPITAALTVLDPTTITEQSVSVSVDAIQCGFSIPEPDVIAEIGADTLVEAAPISVGVDVAAPTVKTDAAIKAQPISTASQMQEPTVRTGAGFLAAAFAVAASILLPFVSTSVTVQADPIVAQSHVLDTNVVTTSTPTYVGRGSLLWTASQNLTVGLPSGWQADDIFICHIAARDNVAVTPPAGWNAINAGTNNGTGLRTSTFWHRAEVDDVAPTFSRGSGSGNASAVVVAYRGCASVSVIDVTGTASTGSSGLVTGSSVTTATDNTMIVFVGCNWYTSGVPGGSFASYSGSPTPTERADFPNATNYPSIFVADCLVDTAGTASGTRTAQASISGAQLGNTVGQLFGLKPNVSGSISPIQITTGLFEPTIIAQQNVTVTPDPISITAEVSEATFSSAFIVYAAPVSASVSVLEPTIITETRTAVDPISAGVTMLEPQVRINIIATPAPISASVGILDPAVSASATIRPASITLQSLVLPPSVKSTNILAVGSVSATISLPEPTVKTDHVVKVNPISATTSIQAPFVALDWTQSVSPATAAFGILTPTIHTDAIVQVPCIGSSVSVLEPIARASVVHHADPIALNETVVTPVSFKLDWTQFATPISGSFSILMPDVGGVAYVYPDPQRLAFTFLQPTIKLGWTQNAAPISATFGLLQPTVRTDYVVVAEPIQSSANVPAPVVHASAIIQAPALAVTQTINPVVVGTGTTTKPTPIGSTVGILTPTIRTSTAIQGQAIRVQSGVLTAIVVGQSGILNRLYIFEDIDPSIRLFGVIEAIRDLEPIDTAFREFPLF